MGTDLNHRARSGPPLLDLPRSEELNCRTRQLGSLAGPLSMSVSLLLLSSRLNAGSVELQLIPATPTIRQEDPVFLKVVLKNKGRHPIRLERPFSDPFGAIGLEMRRKGETTYTRTYTKMGGSLLCAEFHPTSLPPSARLVAYVALFRQGYTTTAVFSEPGFYELRATTVVSGRAVSSAPVSLHVTTIAEPERQFIEKAGIIIAGPSGRTFNILNAVIGTEIPPTNKLEELAEIESGLTESNLRRTLGWVQMLLKIVHSDDASSRNEAMTSLDKVRQRLDVVTIEVMDLALASSLANKHDWEGLRMVLSRIREPSDDRESLLRVLKANTRERD